MLFTFFSLCIRYGTNDSVGGFQYMSLTLPFAKSNPSMQQRRAIKSASAADVCQTTTHTPFGAGICDNVIHRR